MRAELYPIGPILESAGCYRYQAEVVRRSIPDYDETWPMKLVLPNVVERDRVSIFTVVAQGPDGCERRARLTAESYRAFVAATNMKQRTRTPIEYYWADRLHYAVTGTPNRLEYDQGFYVKGGDGADDFKPIAHLYKSQVHALAEFLGVPPDILGRPPTTDTFSLPQTEEEFYFGLPSDLMDWRLYGKSHAVPAADIAVVVSMTAEQVERVYRDIEAKRRAIQNLHLSPLTVEPVPGVDQPANLSL